MVGVIIALAQNYELHIIMSGTPISEAIEMGKQKKDLRHVIL